VSKSGARPKRGGRGRGSDQEDDDPVALVTGLVADARVSSSKWPAPPGDAGDDGSASDDDDDDDDDGASSSASSEPTDDEDDDFDSGDEIIVFRPADSRVTFIDSSESEWARAVGMGTEAAVQFSAFFFFFFFFFFL
jgi:hypothetical protein